ncbi:hypothetical protein, partial [Klebsiella pneumoniae]|uniref:hypothetical protein n=1 Tax=Klebsiella pneumoniae TaxID=573 RepID=UPI0019D6D57C
MVDPAFAEYVTHIARNQNFILLHSTLNITRCLDGTESSLNQLGEIEINNIDECVDAQKDNTLYNFNAAERKVR